jgi:hypothetical protein
MLLYTDEAARASGCDFLQRQNVGQIAGSTYMTGSQVYSWVTRSLEVAGSETNWFNDAQDI